MGLGMILAPYPGRVGGLGTGLGSLVPRPCGRPGYEARDDTRLEKGKLPSVQCIHTCPTSPVCWILKVLEYISLVICGCTLFWKLYQGHYYLP